MIQILNCHSLIYNLNLIWIRSAQQMDVKAARDDSPRSSVTGVTWAVPSSG